MTQGGNASTKQTGFTIVETLIVLAVTGVLLSSAFLFINGRQSKTEFQIGIREVQQQFQQVINEVSSGYFPDTSDFSCTPGVSGPVTITSAAQAQGTNADCIFVGKAFTAGKPRPDSVGVFSLAGARVKGGNDVTTLLDARPAAIDKGNASNTSAPTSVTTNFQLTNGITFVWAKVKPVGGGWSGPLASSGNAEFGLAVVNSLATFSNQTLQMYYLHSPKWSTANTQPLETDAINDEVTATTIPDNWQYVAEQASYCFASAGTNQSGLVTIGNGGGGLTVLLTLHNGKNCA